MNIITYDAAYSLYPKATFGERRTLALSVETPNEERALGKYAVRGWRITQNILSHEERDSKSSFYLDSTRWVDDKKSWVVSFDLSGVVMPPPLSMTSESFDWDPSVQNSWTLIKRGRSKVLITYRVAKSTLFRYNYLVADVEFMKMLLGFFQDQGGLEVTKREHLSAEEKRLSVTWYVSIHGLSVIGLTGLIGGTPNSQDSARHI